ncbi:homeobox-leucine zipper family protein [Arabidopsis lyrata subsp. lyrata]|uniref:Homeobox-leucine zipper family protein n=2 Tax=Arabidopsis lyrata subsp. lyrata TaxID=81972 RepID=D7M2Q8_ARALL|nr:homeobox-leucine zipper family protein [Arabidopsis lyrata subsp. lyrata]
MALENFYNEHKYPTEDMKGKLAEEVGLTEKQVSGWFCHRRLKDKRHVKEDGNAVGSQDRSSVVLQDRGSGLRQDSCGSTKQTDYWNPKPREVESQRLYGGSYMGNADGEDSTSSDRSSSLHKNLVSSKDGIRDVESSRYVAHKDVIQNPQVMRSYGYNKPSGYLKVKGESENFAITAVKRQLGRQYQEDGPPLGVEFDPLPPGAFEPQTNTIVQEPIYVGNQRRSHPPHVLGTRKSFNPGPSYELARKSKMHSPDPDSEDDDDDDDDNIMVGMEPGLRDKKSLGEPRRKSPSPSFYNSVPHHKSFKETLKGSPREISVTNSKNGRISSKSWAEGSRNNMIANFHNLSGSNIETNQSHDYDKHIFNGGRKTGYLTKSSKLLPPSRSRSPDSMDRGPSSGMAGKYHGERNQMKTHREKLHSTDEPPVAKRVKHGYIQQVYAPKSSYSEILERKSQINRSGVELPTSLSGDDETDESSSSSMD